MSYGTMETKRYHAQTEYHSTMTKVSTVWLCLMLVSRMPENGDVRPLMHMARPGATVSSQLSVSLAIICEDYWCWYKKAHLYLILFMCHAPVFYISFSALLLYPMPLSFRCVNQLVFGCCIMQVFWWLPHFGSMKTDFNCSLISKNCFLATSVYLVSRIFYF